MLSTGAKHASASTVDGNGRESRAPVRSLFSTAESFMANLFTRRSSFKDKSHSPPPPVNVYDFSCFPHSSDSLTRRRLQNSNNNNSSSGKSPVKMTKMRSNSIGSSNNTSAQVAGNSSSVSRFQKRHETLAAASSQLVRSLNSSPVRTANTSGMNKINSSGSLEFKCDSIPEESEDDLLAELQQAVPPPPTQPVSFERQMFQSRSARFVNNNNASSNGNQHMGELLNSSLTTGMPQPPARRRVRDVPINKNARRVSYHSAPPGIYWPEFLESLKEEEDSTEDETSAPAPIAMEDYYYGSTWFGSGNNLFIKSSHEESSEDFYEPVVSPAISARDQAKSASSVMPRRMIEDATIKFADASSPSSPSLSPPVPSKHAIGPLISPPVFRTSNGNLAPIGSFTPTNCLSPLQADNPHTDYLDMQKIPIKREEDLTYEEAWDVKLNRKLASSGQLVAERDDKAAVSPPGPSDAATLLAARGIGYNPTQSAFKIPINSPANELGLMMNLRANDEDSIVPAIAPSPSEAAPPVPRHTNVGKDDLSSQPWFYPGYNRARTELALRGQPEGTFLVRASETKSQEYVLSIQHQGNVTHMLISENANGKYVLGRFSSEYDSVVSIVKNFLTREIRIQNAVTIKLTQPLG